jgi:hypothetical protein
MTNIHALKPGDLLVLLNSTPLGQVCDERNLRGIRQGYGLRIGGPGTVDLLRYTARLRLDRRPTDEAPAAMAEIYVKARERLRLQREQPASQSQQEVHATESQAGPITRRILDNPRWPITPALRGKVVESLEVMMESSPDERVRLSASRTLVAVEKVNIDVAKLEMMEDVVRQQMAAPSPLAVPAVPDAQEKPKNIFERMKELEEFYANSDGLSDGPAPGRRA